MAGPREPSDLVRALLIRYVTVKPEGLLLDPEAEPVEQVSAILVRSSPARTLYEARRPICRSLDGVRAFNGRDCLRCPERGACTPQVLVELDIAAQPYRLLLAFTSAKNFLLFVDRTLKEGKDLARLPVRIRVLNRGRWGEVLFAIDRAGLVA